MIIIFLFVSLQLSYWKFITGHWFFDAYIDEHFIFNQNEVAGSFSNPFTGLCLKSTTITTTIPRVPGGLGSGARALVRMGQVATMRWRVNGAVGLIMTPTGGTNIWSGIRTLHKTNVAANTLIIPVYVPTCEAGF